MTRLVRDIRNAAIEECAKVIEDFPDTILQFWDRPGGPPGNGYRSVTRADLANALRALVSSQKDSGNAS